MNKREIRIKVTETRTTTYVVETEGDIDNMVDTVKAVAAGIRYSDDFYRGGEIKCGDIAQSIVQGTYTSVQKSNVEKIEVSGDNDENSLAVSVIDRSVGMVHL